ncbi:Mov34/MPN/PAD-1 family protein [Hyphococcus sp.]|uniref:Mov34/MPN/PAD-1 family protein n=1 Tax=Hyphococcus sp. TaxID=2038636 RepID=UPI0035C6957C
MMIDELLSDEIEARALTSKRSKRLAAAIEANRSPYFRLISCHLNKTHEFLAIEVDVEVAQDRTVAINPTEPLVVAISRENEDSHPEVYPRRNDFPIDQVHVMVDAKTGLHSLCLYDAPFREIRSRTTPFAFLVRVKGWLERAAAGTLHPQDQTLEPVLVGAAGIIILPHGETDFASLGVTGYHQSASGKVTLRVAVVSDEGAQGSSKFVVKSIVADTRVAGASTHTPHTLADLSVFLEARGIDLAKELHAWAMTLKKNAEREQAIPLLFIRFPQQRADDKEIESAEVWAFVVNASIKELGSSLGTFENTEHGAVPLVGASIQKPALDRVGISPLIVMHDLDRKGLAAHSGNCQEFDHIILAIGVGTLGSKVLELSLRAGFGRWSICDDDVFLPHNVARHVLGDWAVGRAKVAELKNYLNASVPGDAISGALENDFLTDFDADEMQAAIKSSELVLDMSASVPVARKLADAKAVKRAASIFLNPKGTDLVVLRENSDRSISLLELEADYYGALVSSDDFLGHLATDQGAPVRYGAGCRHVSAVIGAEAVSILGGIAAAQIRRINDEMSALASIWRLDGASHAIARFDLPISSYRKCNAGNWSLHWSHALLVEIAAMRSMDLPNETGGVLLGMVDFDLQRIFVCSMIEPPPDSTKRPHYFERGRTGLAERLIDVDAKTAGHLRYVGEWHSHPTGVAARPSPDDDRLFEGLKTAFNGTGEPYLMSIMGDAEFFYRFGCDECIAEGSLVLSDFLEGDNARRTA